MRAARQVLSGQLLRPVDRRVRRHHDAPGRDHIGFAPHPSDLLGGRVIDGPVARAGNVRLDALVAFALLVGFERAGKDVDDLAAGGDLLLLAFRRQAAAKFVIQPGVAEVALLVSYPFLQAAVRLDREFRHDASPNGQKVPGMELSAANLVRAGGQTMASFALQPSYAAANGRAVERSPSRIASARCMENSRARAS